MPEKVLLHHNKIKEIDDNYIFLDIFVSFFFLVGVIDTTLLKVLE